MSGASPGKQNSLSVNVALGEAISLARLRRNLTVQELVGMARPAVGRTTVLKVLSGDPSVALGAYSRVVEALGLTDAFSAALSGVYDVEGQKVMDANLGKTAARKPRRRK